MTVKIIAENILDEDDFLSATEQEGERIGQPFPGSANAGVFRLLSKGDIADFSYSGTVTGDGAADGSTTIDSVLDIYGDDYFIDGTIVVSDFIQDNGDYTEQDGPGRIALTDANTVTVTALDSDEEVWLYIDEGADHFSGDFEFHLGFICTANEGVGNWDRCSPWALTNSVDTLLDLYNLNEDWLGVYWQNQNGTQRIVLAESNGGVGGTLTSDIFLATVGVQYYLKIVRDESVGTYGTLYCYIYTGSIDGVLVDTLEVILTEKEDFRYLFWMNSYEGGQVGDAWDGVISDVEIVKSESKPITDFAQATGTITTAAFSYPVCIGTTFTLTVPYATRDFRTVLITGGDAGDATFKWSHDGGTTYLGRDDPDQANWLAEKVECAGHFSGYTQLIECNDESWLLFYNSGAAAGKVRRSTDKGLTWGAAVAISTSSFYCALKLDSGRILAFGGATPQRYSDDNGVTWTTFPRVPDGADRSMVELYDGNIVLVYELALAIYCIISADGGVTWSSAVTIAADANDQRFPVVVQAVNGDIVCAYRSDEDAIGDNEIKCKISTDGGTTWGSVIAVMNFVADIDFPFLCVDINGDIYCSATTNSNIVYAVSTDNGASWGATTTLHDTGDVLGYSSLAVMQGHQMVCVYANSTDGKIETVRRGIWEAYAANACPCAIETMEQKLICEVGIVWHGGAGIADDSWSFVPEYVYRMANLIEDSPSKPWRSEQDNIECSIVIDMGANVKHYADGVGFFGTNFRTLNFQMHDTDVWVYDDDDIIWKRVDFNFEGLENGYWLNGIDAYINLDSAAAELVDTNNTKGSIVWKGQVHDFTTDHGHLWQFGDTNAVEYIYLRISPTDYKLVAKTSDAGAEQWSFITDNTFSEDVNYTIIIVQNGTAPILYVNGELEPITFSGEVDKTSWFHEWAGIDNGRIGDRSNAGSGEANFANISVNNFYAFNNDLTAAEVLALSSSDEETAAVPWKYLGASQTPKQSDTEWAGAVGAVPPTGWGIANNGVFTIFDSGDGAPYDVCLKIATDGGGVSMIYRNYDSAVIGKRYRVEVMFKAGDATGARFLVGSTLNGSQYLNEMGMADASWTKYSVEFTATTTRISISLRVDGAIGLFHLYDQCFVTRIGCVAQYEPDGVTDATWLDKSTNDLDGTVSGALPNGDRAGDIVSVNGNVIKITFASSTTLPKDHELTGLYFRATTGTDAGIVWKIKDNITTDVPLDQYIYLDTTAATNLAADDIFGIFQSSIPKEFAGHVLIDDEFTPGIKRFIRVNIPAQQTEENYYQLGMMVAGRTITLDKEWGPGYQKKQQYDIEMLRTPHGGMIPMKGSERKRVFNLTWPTSETARLEVVALTDYIEGRNLCFIPDDDDLTDCYLVKQPGDINQTHRARTYFDFTIILEEIL